MHVAVITPPSEEPITLAEAKTHLRVDGDDEDALITGYIIAARIACEMVARRAFVTQTLLGVLDDWPTTKNWLYDQARRDVIELLRPPLTSVTSVVYRLSDGTQQTWGTGNYVVDAVTEPGRIALAHNVSWPSDDLYPIGAIHITYQAGYGAAVSVPELYKQAIKLQLAYIYENRESMGIEAVSPAVRGMLMMDRG